MKLIKDLCAYLKKNEIIVLKRNEIIVAALIFSASLIIASLLYSFITIYFTK